jgi:hypothetical protein
LIDHVQKAYLEKYGKAPEIFVTTAVAGASVVEE